MVKTINVVSLADLFEGRQEEMSAKLKHTRKNIKHEPTKGSVTELCWCEMLEEYLPRRYAVTSGFVLDSDGKISNQIDVIIYDRQFSPFLLSSKGSTYVPAESVYAVFEVKQSLNRNHIEYAATKIESVRSLHRTSAPIPHAGGEFPPKKIFEIIGGLLCLSSDWKEPYGDSFLKVISSLAANKRLNLGCVLEAGSFSVKYTETTPQIHNSSPQHSLITFFIDLLQVLQALGTVSAIDFEAYRRAIK